MVCGCFGLMLPRVPSNRSLGAHALTSCILTLMQPCPWLGAAAWLADVRCSKLCNLQMEAFTWKQRFSEAAEAGPPPPGTPPQEAVPSVWAIPAQRSPLQALTGSAAKMPRRMRESVADFELRKSGGSTLGPAGVAALESLSPRSSQKLASRHHSMLSGAEENAEPLSISQARFSS